MYQFFGQNVSCIKRFDLFCDLAFQNGSHLPLLKISQKMTLIVHLNNCLAG